MSRDQIRFLLSGILFGFLVGYLIAYSVYEPRVKHEADPVPAAGNMGMSAPGPGAPPPSGSSDAAQPGSEQTMARVFEAVKQLKEAIEKNPKDVEALTRLANFYQDAGKYDQAVEYYQKALEVRPESVDPRTDMGICLREMGKPDEAIAQFKKSVAIDPKHWQSWLNLGVVSLFDKKDPETAAAAFQKLEELNPGFRDLPALKDAVRQARSTASPAS